MKQTTLLFCLTLIHLTALHANPDLTGAWTATVEYNHSFDTYKITFDPNGSCTVRVSNDKTGQETLGNWSHDGSLFRLNAVFRNPQIAYLPQIAWAGVLNVAADNNSFSILGRAATNGPAVRLVFFRSDGRGDDRLETAFNEKAVPQLFEALTKNIPGRSRLAIAGITAADPAEAAFYLDELTLRFVNSGNYTVVERGDIDQVLAEQNFQLSGYVDDDAAVSIGKFTGAAVVLMGSVSGTGPQKRLVLKAIDVASSEILSMAQASL